MSPDLTLVAGAIGVSVRVCLGAIFLHAAVGKLRNHAFIGALAGYELLPRWALVPVARALPIFELLLGGGLIAGVAPAVFAGIAGLLLLVFAAAMVVNLRRGRRHIDCGCSFSGGGEQISYPLVTRNLVLAAVACVAIAPAPVLGGLAYAAAAAGGAIFFSLYLLINVLLNLTSRHRSRGRAAWNPS